MPKTRKDAPTLIERIEEAYSIIDEILAQKPDAELRLKALEVNVSVMEIHGRLTGAFQQDRENEHDVSRKIAMYEHGVARLLAGAAEHGFEFSREEAIKRLSVFVPDIGNYIH